ncbi:kynureninase [Flavisolibacter sp. BT320]|nr:kynureninase [Flavisolibacter longurius]
MAFQPTLAYAKEQDAQDASRHYRNRFLIPQHEGKDAIYFLGNSLGLQPKETEKAIQDVLVQWSQRGVEGFFRGERPWLEYHRQLQPALSQIVGALPEEVVAMNQLTVNLHLMLVSFYQPSGGRTKILCEAKAFPSDQYMLYTHVKQRGLNPDETIIEVTPTEGEVTIREEDILAAIKKHGDELALVFWGGVNYYTGQVFDMKKITSAAQAVGAKAGFDLAHAVGNVPLQLHNWNVDFACWCSYKYLNSGPGGIGGAYIHQRYHNDSSLNRFAGWWGNKKETQFLMEKEFDPEPSAEGWQLSTPSPIQYAAHKTALDLFAERGVETVFADNGKLTDYTWAILKTIQTDLPQGAIQLLTPESSDNHSCQLSMQVKNGKQVFDELSRNGIFADWREPDVIRIAPVSFYNTFEDVWRFAQVLKTAVLTFAQ